MPIYNFKCPKCQQLKDVHRKHEKRNKPLFCDNGCSGYMERLYTTAGFSISGPGTEAYETAKKPRAN